MLHILKKELIELDINGQKRTAAVRPADTLLHILRQELGLTGAKPGCENGDCNACIVLLDDIPVKACIMLAAEAIGHKITTIEGIKSTPIQKAFLDKFAYQCGYCTPGYIVTCHALINRHPHADDNLITEWLESGICRCTGYEEIKEAVKQALHDNNLIK